MTVDLETEFGDTVMGIDEAGRGPLAGGVFAAAVSVPVAEAAALLAGAWSEVNDSKKLTAAKREALAEVIKSTSCCTWCVASASPAEIDSLNILRATHLAMKRAALGVAAKILNGCPGEAAPSPLHNTGNASPSLRDEAARAPLPRDISFKVLVDGLPVKGLPFPSRNVVKGDAKSLLIAAASILAKTARDADCLRLEAQYPGYGFAKHKGYPTPEHLAALRELGPCPEHRMSFGPVAQMTLF